MHVQTSLPLHSWESTHHCPGTSYVGFQSGETCRKFQPQGPLQPQELCTQHCKGCEPDKGGVVGLGHSCAASQPTQLSACQYSLAWDRLIELARRGGLRGRGVRGRPAANLPHATNHPRPPCGRSTFLSPERERQIARCGCLPQLCERWGRTHGQQNCSPRTHVLSVLVALLRRHSGRAHPQRRDTYSASKLMGGLLRLTAPTVLIFRMPSCGVARTRW